MDSRNADQGRSEDTSGEVNPIRHKYRDWLPFAEGEEEIYFWEHPTLVAEIPALVIGLVLAIAGVVGYITLEQDILAQASLVLIPVSLLIIALEYIILIKTHYIISDTYVIKKTGIIADNKDYYAFDSVGTVDSTTKSGSLYRIITQWLFGYGDVEVSISGDQDDAMFENVASYQRFKTVVLKKRQEHTVKGVMENQNEKSDSGESQSDEEG